HQLLDTALGQRFIVAGAGRPSAGDEETVCPCVLRALALRVTTQAAREHRGDWLQSFAGTLTPHAYVVGLVVLDRVAQLQLHHLTHADASVRKESDDQAVSL